MTTPVTRQATVEPAPRPRLGVAFAPTMPPEPLRQLATAVETAGLDELWVWEDCFKQSGIASAGPALAWTERICVGIGLLPAPLRNVALTAMEIATLERMFPGRLMAGVGHGVQDWMGQVGARVESPMSLLREYTDALRRLLRGERVTVDGRYVHLDDVALDWPPSRPPMLWLGGAGPRSLELCGELGDGTLLSAGMTDEAIAAAIALAARAAVARGVVGPHPALASHIVATGPGAQERVDREVSLWGGTAGRGIGVGGDAQMVAGSMRRLAAAGATTIAVLPTADEPDLVGLVHFLGEQVLPLL